MCSRRPLILRHNWKGGETHVEATDDGMQPGAKDQELTKKEESSNV